MGYIRNEKLLRLFSELDEYIESRFDTWRGWRRHLHAHPELSWEETATTTFIRQQLEQLGLPLQAGPRGKGGIVNFRGDDAGQPLIAVRGDIDAIPVTEETGLAFASQVDGLMHACGHDVHATMALGVCDTLQYLNSNGLSPVPLRARVIFEPAEEVAEGAAEMIEMGALQDVGTIVAMHVDSSREVGCVGFRDGIQTACCDEIEVGFFGEGGHSARPHETGDPVFASAHFINAAYSTIPRLTDSRRAVVLTFCQIAGGKYPNVIPNCVTIKGTLRSFSSEMREQILKQLQHLATATQQSLGVRVEVNHRIGTPPVINAASANDLLIGSAETFLPEDSITEVEPSLGGEDFACYQQKIPGALLRIGSACGDRGRAHLHSPHFDVDEEVLRVAVSLFTRSVLQWSQSVA
jgi:amidohydrolase